MSDKFIQTRGKFIDYGFIINAPKNENSWWGEYSRFTAFEFPTIIIENISDYPRIYLSAIPSGRKDRVETIIRYTLVIELLDNQHDQNAFFYLVSIWLDEVGKHDKCKPKESNIGKLLDECFTEEVVEELLQVQEPDSKYEEKLQNKWEEFINKLSIPGFSGSMKDDIDKMWYGGIRDDESRKTWISLVSKLLNNKVKGKALFLNLATDNDVANFSSKVKNQNIGLLINNDSTPKPLPSNISNILNILNIIKNNNLKLFALGCVLVGLFIFYIPIIFPANKLSESEVINFVVASCPAAIKATNPTPNSQKSEIQLTNLTAIPNSPNSENQTTNLTPTPNSPNSENQTTNSTAIPNSSNSENQTTNSNSTPNSSNSEIKSTNLTPTPNSPKPEIQVIKEELATAEELANKLGVNKDTLLSEMKKCHESFKKWSEQFGKGKWDFKINGSQIIFKKVIKN